MILIFNCWIKIFDAQSSYLMNFNKELCLEIGDWSCWSLFYRCNRFRHICALCWTSIGLLVMSERKGHKSDGRVKEKTSSSIWNKDGNDFICIPQFHNTIPSAPSGPYLKNLDQQNRYQDFAVYKTSSLEKNYIWQPHFGPDLGLRLDLVDQEAILNPISIRNEDAIDASEMRLLKGDAPDRGRGKLRSLEGGEKSTLR